MEQEKEIVKPKGYVYIVDENEMYLVDIWYDDNLEYHTRWTNDIHDACRFNAWGVAIDIASIVHGEAIEKGE